MTVETAYNIRDEVWFADDDIALKGEIAGVSISVYSNGSDIRYIIITETETYCLSESKCFRTMREMLKVCSA